VLRGLTDPWHNQGCSGAPGQTQLQARRHHEGTDLCADDDADIVQDRQHVSSPAGRPGRWETQL